jgi:hypothetical protein
MSAREMFEELGWEESDNRNYPHMIMYRRQTPQHIQRISFDNRTKKFSCACLDDTYVKKGFRMKNTPMHCDINIFKATQQQIKELNWEE